MVESSADSYDDLPRRNLEEQINQYKVKFYEERHKKGILKAIMPFGLSRFMEGCYLNEYKDLQNIYKFHYSHYFFGTYSKKEIKEELNHHGTF